MNPFAWNAPRGPNQFCWKFRYQCPTGTVEGQIFLPIQSCVKEALECFLLAVKQDKPAAVLLTRRYPCTGEQGTGCGDLFDSILELEIHRRQCDGHNAQSRKVPQKRKVDNQDDSLL